MGAKSSIALRVATRVYARNVDRREVAREYLKGEFARWFVSKAQSVGRAIDQMVDSLEDGELWRLLEGIGASFRLNAVFFEITDEGVDWHDLELPIGAIRMSGIDRTVDKVLGSKAIGWDPLRFADWLRDNPCPLTSEEVESNFDEFRPRKGGVRHPMITVVESNNRLTMRDGSHRLIAQALEGRETTRAFVAVPNGKRHRSMGGDAIYIRLLSVGLPKTRRPKDRDTLVAAAELIARSSSDGLHSLEELWYPWQRKLAVKRLGAELIERLKN